MIATTMPFYNNAHLFSVTTATIVVFCSNSCPLSVTTAINQYQRFSTTRLKFWWICQNILRGPQCLAKPYLVNYKLIKLLNLECIGVHYMLSARLLYSKPTYGWNESLYSRTYKQFYTTLKNEEVNGRHHFCQKLMTIIKCLLKDHVI